MTKIFECVSSFPCKHAFSTRLGGVSKKPFNSLNLSFVCKDNKNDVIANWYTLSRISKIPVDNLVLTNQIHKPNVEKVTIEDGDLPGKSRPIFESDGLVTNNPDVTLAIFTADCAPLLLCDKQAGVIGALHCGWKPFVADIIKNGIIKMQELGASRENIYACVGPCINQCCFETGPEVKEAFDKLLGDVSKSCYELTNKQNNKYHVNLRLGVQKRLEQLDINPEHISHINECTKCRTDKYYSYRAEGAKTGRLAHIIHL